MNSAPPFFFFFSSRRRHTRFDCDWSSDVCSSDLLRSRSQGFARALLAQHLERSEQLVYGLVERREFIAFRRITEESVQNLLDSAQVGTQFRDNLVHEQPFRRR